MTGPSALASAESGIGAEVAVSRAWAGDPGAFEELYHRHVGRVYALCLRMTGDPSRAEEHTQDAFVRAWRKLDSLQGERGFSAWLKRVAINVVLGDRRARTRRGDREQALLPDDVAAPLRERDAAFDLERGIATLPERARAVFVLHDVEGHRHHEIAGLLGVTVGTSKSQLHRARKLLREALRS